MIYTIIISILIVLVIFLSFLYVRVLLRMTSLIKSRNIQFSNILDSNGDHGMVRMSDPLSTYSTDKFFVEFKVIAKSVNKNNKEYINIRVLNVSPIDISENEGLQKGMHLLWEKQWLHDSDGIYWFTDNDARRRDSILKDLLKDEIPNM